ncbi:MAG: UDP-N-acetylglucosamine 2-epimerase, partial [Gammaproteobacteria bacterium]
ARARGVESGTRERLGLPAGGYHVLTVHRAENTGSAEQLRAILDYVAAAVEGAPVVLPVHPRVREMVTGLDLGFTGLHRVDPVPYLDMADLLANARSVFTDSGGLQKECYFHRVPCVTLRSETEWRETIDAGWNRLWTDADYAGERRDIADYGSGDAAPRIAAAVRAFLER